MTKISLSLKRRFSASITIIRAKCKLLTFVSLEFIEDLGVIEEVLTICNSDLFVALLEFLKVEHAIFFELFALVGIF